MPFTDAELSGAMHAAMIQSHVMTEGQYQQLMDDGRTEDDVRNALTPLQISAFPRYWLLTNRWLVQHGGTVKTIQPRNVPGRIPGIDPVSNAKRTLYEDAFSGTQRHIATEIFSDVKAISNALRFIEFMLNDAPEA